MEHEGDVVLNAIAQKGLAKEGDFERAIALAEETGEVPEQVLVQLGVLTENALADVYADTLGLSRLSPNALPEDALFGDILSPKFLVQAHVLPVKQEDDGVVIALANPRDALAIGGMEFACRQDIIPTISTRSDIDDAIYRLYDISPASDHLSADLDDDDLEYSEEAGRLRDLASEAPIVQLVNMLISRAVESSASDIHIEPLERRMRIRLRIDGVLSEVESPPLAAAAAIVSRTKIMAGLDIAERRLPQDGRTKVVVRGKPIDLRVSTVPTNHGESVVLRILDRGALNFEFDELGFDETTRQQMIELLELPHGVLLVTGPTGSGKTTTLYTALSQLNTQDRKILTIEDPIEYVLEGVNQSQVNPDIGRTFAQGLRSFLRQDPDIMMVGEIRDVETADIAIQAALTGHLVLSTLHTNDAVGGVTRLLDMGIDDYMITSAVVGLMAQRLVRKLCPDCMAPYQADTELIKRVGLDQVSNSRKVTLYKPVGCDACHGIGFRGRIAIVEILKLSDAFKGSVLNRASHADLTQQAIADGMRPLLKDGLVKALGGLTTIDEVLRVTRDL